MFALTTKAGAWGQIVNKQTTQEREAIRELPKAFDKTLRNGLALSGALAMLPVKEFSDFLENRAAALQVGLSEEFFLAVILREGLAALRQKEDEILADVVYLAMMAEDRGAHAA